ncbi:MAG TPA: hypothetical protein P5256_19645, partial [Beijerinckiaceae bacterium]|nr:hypothetical protein [Beijerinckiaceae bacterium]
DAGVTCGLGVDGSASNDTSNMFLEARLAQMLQRVAPNRYLSEPPGGRGGFGGPPKTLSAREALTMATSAKTVAALSQGWSKLEAKWAKAAPPQYADDAKFAPMLGAAAGEIATANKQIADGQLGAAHLTLEKIRDQLGELRARNNISTTSDRMNEFHEEMEKTLEHAKSDITPAVLGDLRGEGAVLAYLIDRIAAAPPPEARNSEEFGQLVLATKAAVKAVREAAASGDAAAAKRALQGLKKPYAILFLKFG